MIYLSDTWETFTHNGKTYAARLERDETHGAPWIEECGHGPVTGWERRDKVPGELILAEDRGMARFYDFQEACKIARRDGWGFLPGELVTDRFAHSGKRKFRAYVARPDPGFLDLLAYGPDINSAILSLYAMHKATMTPRQYAAEAARRDYERMRQWCNDVWSYVGVIVAPVCPCCDEIDESESRSLWGIESDAGDYLQEVARELADEIGSEKAQAA